MVPDTEDMSESEESFDTGSHQSRTKHSNELKKGKEPEPTEKREKEESPSVQENDSEPIINGKHNLFQKGFVKIQLGVELWPSNEEILIVSIDQEGLLIPNSLHGVVLKKIGFDLDSIKFSNKELEDLAKKSLTSKVFERFIIFFVSTINYSDQNLSEKILRIKKTVASIYSEFDRNISFPNPTYYLPLLGTGYSGIPTMDSFNMIIDEIEDLTENSSKPVEITLSLPYDIEEGDLERVVGVFSETWEPISKPFNKSIPIKDKIDFHLDDPALEDKLGRRPIANSLAKLINDDIFGNKKCHAFMAHLQGRWGEGKSSFMKFLEDGLQETGDNRWIIIHYNAWKNQYVDPPWWTFLDVLYRQGREQLPKKYKRKIIWNERIRRMNSGTLLAFSIIAFIIFLAISASNLLNIPFPNLSETTKVIVSVSTIFASLWAVGQAWSKFFVMDTPENARLFMRRVENPSAHIKQHFEELIKDLQTQHKKENPDHHIAVFIDDLDRCDGKFVVSLLEGIQTMFNEQKVFYLAAADKHWVAKSFENVYSEYTDTVKKGTKLGYSFIEKNFQLSIRLPNPSQEQISRYWGYILKHRTDIPTKEGEDKEGLKSKLQETGQEAVLSGEANLEELAEEFNTTIEDAQSIMLQTVNETTEDIEHLLMEHHELLGNNPRAVKRLANQYTVYRNLVLIEQNKVDPLKLFRWVVLQNRWPVLIDKLEHDPAHINDYDELLEELNLVSYSIDIDYVMGKEKERLTTEDVITFTGIGNLAPID